jgi:hypothetical protein
MCELIVVRLLENIDTKGLAYIVRRYYELLKYTLTSENYWGENSGEVKFTRERSVINVAIFLMPSAPALLVASIEA